MFLALHLLISLFHSQANASYYDVLPKGVNNFTYRFVQTGKIKGAYNNAGNLLDYSANANINADSIRGINSAVDTYLNSLSADDYKNFSFGAYKGNAESKVSAQAFGFGRGLFDKLTAYAYVPFYSASVDLNLKRTKEGRTNVGGAIVLDGIPEVDLRLIQSLFVNYYHYQPLGKWHASDFGDTEFGFMYQLKKDAQGGALMSLGGVAPTGRKDNPDILQDFAFGDGQWDAFFEFGGGLNLNSSFSLENWNRFTYQFPYHTTLRLPDSESFPVTQNKGEGKIKLGNKWQSNVQFNYLYSEEWSSSLLYTLDFTQKTDYDTARLKSDAILESNTEKLAHIARLNFGYSTVSLYLKKQFMMPLNFNIAFQSIVGGKNTPKYERADLEVRFYF